MLKRFNKLIALVVAVVLLVSALGISASATPVVPKLTIGTASGAAEADVSVDITVENFKSVCGMELYISFTGLTLKSVASTAFTLKKDENYAVSYLSGSVLSFVESGDAGTVSDTIKPLIDANTSTKIMTLTFTIPKTATLNQKFDVSVLTTAPRKSIFADTNSALLSNVSTTNGSVTCNKVAPKISFGDVGKSEWYYDAVSYCSDLGIMTGTSAGVFSPAQTLTRSQFATIIYRVAGTPSYTPLRSFPDVPAGTWFTDAVLWANSKGIISGYQNGYFGAADNITREQMAVIMYRYAQFNSYDVSATKQITGFSDYGSVSDYAITAFKWAYSKGIITGKDAGTRLDPGGNTLRCECAAIITRFINTYE